MSWRGLKWLAMVQKIPILRKQNIDLFEGIFVIFLNFITLPDMNLEV